MDLNYKQMGQLFSVIDSRIAKSNLGDQSSQTYMAEVTFVSTDGLTADCKMLTSGEDAILRGLKNKTGVLLNIGDEVFLIAPRNDLSNIYIDKSKFGHTIDGTKVDGIDWTKLQNVSIDVADIANLDAQYAHITNGVIDNATINVANIGSLTADFAHITEGVIDNATINVAKINDLSANYAHILNGIIDNATIDVANIRNLTASVATIATATIKEATIGMAQISDLDVAKFSAGTIDSSKVDIASPDGRLIIKDNSILTYDYINNDLLQPYLRTQMGRIWDVVDGVLVPRQEANGDYVYGFEVKDKTGQSTMIDGNGVHNEGIVAGAVDNSKISPNAKIDGAKLDIQTVINHINADGTTTIEGSKIYVDNTTLDLKLTSIETNVTYQVDIISTNGNIFKNGEISTTLMARVYHGAEDMTDTIDVNRFKWTRISSNTESDTAWNTSHFGGTKQIVVTQTDVYMRATFNCDILD